MSRRCPLDAMPEAFLIITDTHRVVVRRGELHAEDALPLVLLGDLEGPHARHMVRQGRAEILFAPFLCCGWA